MKYEFEKRYLSFAISIIERMKYEEDEELDILSFAIIVGNKYSIGLSFGAVKII